MNTNLDALKDMLINLGCWEEDVNNLTTVKDALVYFLRTKGIGEGEFATNEEALKVLAELAPSIIGGDPRGVAGSIMVSNNSNYDIGVNAGAVNFSYETEGGAKVYVREGSISIRKGNGSTVYTTLPSYPPDHFEEGKYYASGILIITYSGPAPTVTASGFDTFDKTSLASSAATGNKPGFLCRFYVDGGNSLPRITIT